jgi:hypothetical protein
MAKRKTVPIKWTDDEWAVINKSIYNNLNSNGDISLPLSRSGRYPMSTMLSEAQHMLHVSRHRPVSVVQTPDRNRIIDGVNQLVEAAALALKVKSAPVQAARPPLSLNHKVPKDVSEQKLTLKVDTAPAPEPAAPSAPTKKFLEAMKPEAPAFSFEGLGRMFDNYLANKINASVDAVMLEALKATLPQAVEIAVEAAMPKPLRTVERTAVPGSSESRLLEDMVGVLDEVARLRQIVEALQSPKPAEAEATTPAAAPSTATRIRREAVQVEEHVADVRPLYVVCGAHPTQVEDLRRAFANKLRLKVFADVCPTADLGDCKMTYVFEGHSTKMKVDSLRHKIGRARVTTVRGGLSAIKRELERHVLESQTMVAQAARNLFGN